MAKDKPKNGRRTTDKTSIRGTRATPRSPQHKPTGKKDPGGFKSSGFKSEGFTSGGRKVKTGPPPSVRARDEKRAKQPPPVKYAGKKKAPKKPGYPKPSMPEGWEKWKDRFPKPKPGWGQQPKPGPRVPKKPKPRKPKKPMGKGRAK